MTTWKEGNTPGGTHTPTMQWTQISCIDLCLKHSGMLLLQIHISVLDYAAVLKYGKWWCTRSTLISVRVCKETPTDITPRILAIIAKIWHGFGNCGPTRSLATNTSCTNSPANKSDTAGLKYRVLDAVYSRKVRFRASKITIFPIVVLVKTDALTNAGSWYDCESHQSRNCGCTVLKCWLMVEFSICEMKRSAFSCVIVKLKHYFGKASCVHLTEKENNMARVISKLRKALDYPFTIGLLLGAPDGRHGVIKSKFELKVI